jgi:hypothetical protein
MKLTKRKLQRLIKEELNSLMREGPAGDLEDAKAGDYVEIDISDDGYDKSVDLVNPNDYDNTLSPYMSVKFLAKIVQVAGEELDHEPSESTPESEEDLTDVGGGQFVPQKDVTHYQGQG